MSLDDVTSVDCWPGVSALPLVGRDRELVVLRGLLDAREGAVLLQGEAGVGKSALLAAAAGEQLAEQTAHPNTGAGWRVAATCCTPGDAGRPWSGLSGLLQPLNQDVEVGNKTLGRALAGALEPGPRERPDQLVVANAVLALVRAAGASGPVLLVLDNAHLLDEVSSQTLAFVGRRLAGAQTVLLAAGRAQPGGRLALGALPRLDVAALEPQDAEALVRQRFPNLDEAVRAQVLAAAQGNPLALLELPLGSGVGNDTPGASAARARASTRQTSGALPLSERLRESLLTQIEGLPAATRACLVLVALADAPDLATVTLAWLVFTGGPGGPLPLGPAENLGLLSLDQGGVLRLADPLLRAALVQAMPPTRLRAAHRALAAATSGEPARHAHHLAACADGPDEHVADLLEQAGRALERAGQPQAAVAALVRAGEVSDSDQNRTRRMLAAAHLQVARIGGTTKGRRLLAAGQRAEPDPWDGRPSAARYGDTPHDDGHEVADPDLLPTAVTRAVIEVREALKAPYEIQERLAAALERHSHRPSDNDPGTRARPHTLSGTEPGTFADAERSGVLNAADPLVVAALHLMVHTATYDGRRELWAQVGRFADRLSPGVPESLALQLEANSGDGARMAAAATDLSIHLGRSHAGLGETRIEHVMGAALMLDRTPEARPALEHYAATSRAADDMPALLSALTALGQDAFVSGRWDECLQIGAEGLELCSRYGHSFAPLGFRGSMVMVAAGRGDQAQVAALGGELLDWALPRRVGHLIWPVRQAQALLASARGDADTVWQLMAPLSPLGPDLGTTLRVRWCRWAPDLVDAALRTGRPGEAAELVRHMHRDQAALVSSRLALLVGVAEAMTLSDPGEAAAAFSAATAGPEVERWPFDLARARLWQAEFLRAQGRTQRARPLLESARDAFEALGATPWVIRCRVAARRSAPSTSRPEASEAEASTAWALTEEERETALLAAQGLSNRDIARQTMVSPRTVAGRLYRAFPKLGITSRAALRDVMGDPSS